MLFREDKPMSRQYYFEGTKQEINRKKLAMNFFIIREVYKYMASVDGIKNSMKKFYNYLGVNEDNYDHLVANQYGYDALKPAMDKLIECGFSPTLFRKDSTTLIEMSDILFDMAYDYRFNKSTGINLQEFHSFLGAEIGSIYNPDNTLLVFLVRVLISRITATPEHTLDEFMDIFESIEWDKKDKLLQKDMIKKIEKFHAEYKKLLQNIDE